MPTRPLLCPDPVERLCGQLGRLPQPMRRSAWQVYRLLRQRARSLQLARDIPSLVQHLVGRVREDLPFNVVTLAVKLAQTYTQQHLNMRGAQGRPERAHVREAFFLLRRQLRAALGQRVLEPDLTWRRGAPFPDSYWTAVCDGSYKSSVSSAGVLVYDPTDALRAEVSLPVAAGNAVAAELQACIHALRALLALGCRSALVHVDSVGVLSALRQTLPLRYCVLEAELWLLAKQFRSLQVRLSPRVTTYPADRLAALLSRH